MNDLMLQFTNTIWAMQKNLPFTLGILGLLYAIQFINWSVGYRLNILGIYPRSIHGLLGIFLAPFLHGNFNHIFFNSIPLFILSNFLLLSGYHVFYEVTFFIIIFSGILVWLFGRASIHIGASGVIIGYWSYLLMHSYQQPSVMALALGAICIYYFGSFLFSIIPGDVGKSWESHLFGFIAGIAAAFYFQ
jgi:membrane associated rhomboid family serine protease